MLTGLFSATLSRNSCPCKAHSLQSTMPIQSQGSMPEPLFGGCRIVICGLTGQYIDQIGGNGAALRDGAFDSAAFNRPQGLAFSSKRNCLYVADTENHALREVSAALAASASPMVIIRIFQVCAADPMASSCPDQCRAACLYRITS